MAQTPSDWTEDDESETAEEKARAAARKAARAAAIAETYSTAAGAPDATPAPRPAGQEAGEGEELKLRELVALAAEASGVKKSDAKAAIAAALSALGGALAEGRDINLPGLGKVKLKRTRMAGGNRVSELRLRQKLDDMPRNERVAEDEKGS